MALFFLLAVAILGYVFIYPLMLGSRIKRLEDKFKRLEVEGVGLSANVEPSAEAQPRFETAALTPIPMNPLNSPLRASTGGSQADAKEGDSAFVVWLKEDFLVKVGALLLILAVAWFVAYAFAENWIGPTGRITLGMLFGIGVMIFGTVRLDRSSSQGAIFTILGSTSFILSISAARYFYDMFTPGVALFMMFLAVAYVAFVSLHFERSALAIASLISALLVPFLINLYHVDAFLLMLYLLGIIAGTLWVVWRLRAEIITLIALIGVIIYTPIAGDLDSGVALLFAFIFTAIFFVTNVISLIRRYTEWVSPLHVTTALLTGVYLLYWILISAPEHFRSLYLVVWSLAFAYGSYQLFLRTLNKVVFYIYSAVAFVLLASATVIELGEGSTLTIVLTLEVLASIVLVGRVLHNKTALDLATGLLLVPGYLTLFHISASAWYRGVGWSDDLLALLVFTGTLMVAGLVREHYQNSSFGTGQKILYGLAGIYAGTILWLVLHALLEDGLATMLSLVIYTALGLTAYIIGRTEGRAAVKTVGMIILGFVLFRLLFVDIWTMELSGRIITFFIIGIFFISTAFLPKKEEAGDRPN